MPVQDALEGLRSRLVSGAVATDINEIMSAATSALSAVPGVADPARTRADMMAFERAQQHLEMYEDAVTGTLEDGDAEDESGEIVDQILAEVGISTEASMPSVPRQCNDGDAGVEELLKRMENLKNG